MTMEIKISILGVLITCFMFEVTLTTAQDNPCPQEEPLCPQEPLPPYPACPPQCVYDYQTTVDGVRCKTGCRLVHGLPGPPGAPCPPTGCPNQGIIEPLPPVRDCSNAEFRCDDRTSCVPLIWKCDGDFDCRDRSDEKDC